MSSEFGDQRSISGSDSVIPIIEGKVMDARCVAGGRPVRPLFLAAKGPDGSLGIAGKQACYDGALGAIGIQSLQSYGETQPVYDNAYTIT